MIRLARFEASLNEICRVDAPRWLEPMQIIVVAAQELAVRSWKLPFDAWNGQ